MILSSLPCNKYVSLHHIKSYHCWRGKSEWLYLVFNTLHWECTLLLWEFDDPLNKQLTPKCTQKMNVNDCRKVRTIYLITIFLIHLWSMVLLNSVANVATEFYELLEYLSHERKIIEKRKVLGGGKEFNCLWIKFKSFVLSVVRGSESRVDEVVGYGDWFMGK